MAINILLAIIFFQTLSNFNKIRKKNTEYYQSFIFILSLILIITYYLVCVCIYDMKIEYTKIPFLVFKDSLFLFQIFILLVLFILEKIVKKYKKD